MDGAVKHLVLETGFGHGWMMDGDVYPVGLLAELSNSSHQTGFMAAGKNWITFAHSDFTEWTSHVTESYQTSRSLHGKIQLRSKDRKKSGLFQILWFYV